MRKQISVTNETVLEIFEQQENVSKFIEKAVLWYVDFKEHDYITRQEVMELLEAHSYATASTSTAKQEVNKSDLKGILDL